MVIYKDTSRILIYIKLQIDKHSIHIGGAYYNFIIISYNIR